MSRTPEKEACVVKRAISERRKAILFFTHLFFILLAYYQLKPLSRTLFITYIGSENLPYVWIATAVMLLILMPFFQWRLKRFSPLKVSIASSLSFAILILWFRQMLNEPGSRAVVAFYILIDVYSVVLVENSWSLINGAFRTNGSKTWYGFIGSGGLIGAAAGGFLATALLSRAAFKQLDLLYVAVIFLVVLIGLTRYLPLEKKLESVEDLPENERDIAGFKSVSKVVALIAFFLFLTQLVEPIVEFQFMSTVEASITESKARTAYLSTFFAILSSLALGLNLLATPFIHRRFGIFAGLYIQPALVSSFALLFMYLPTLNVAAGLKIADRGLSYSLNRASKENLYLPLPSLLIHRTKVWIDLLGYRLFKIFGALIVLAVTDWVWHFSLSDLSWVLFVICAIWVLTITQLKKLYVKTSVR